MEARAAEIVPLVNSNQTQARLAAFLVPGDPIKDYLGSIFAIHVRLGNMLHPLGVQAAVNALLGISNQTQEKLAASDVLLDCIKVHLGRDSVIHARLGNMHLPQEA